MSQQLHLFTIVSSTYLLTPLRTGTPNFTMADTKEKPTSREMDIIVAALKSISGPVTVNFDTMAEHLGLARKSASNSWGLVRKKFGLTIGSGPGTSLSAKASSSAGTRAAPATATARKRKVEPGGFDDDDEDEVEEQKIKAHIAKKAKTLKDTGKNVKREETGATWMDDDDDEDVDEDEV
ncbi:hypothetical protein F5Y15DRAFT_429944 [Xylariaceae sp. FL0016]|nr:hypothetical protein F5Y15DRAFT_429944 [Xylariaceae sp. FL0016]